MSGGVAQDAAGPRPAALAASLPPPPLGLRGATGFDQLHLQTSLDWPYPLRPNSRSRQPVCTSGASVFAPKAWARIGTVSVAVPPQPNRTWVGTPVGGTHPMGPLETSRLSSTASRPGSRALSTASSRPGTAMTEGGKTLGRQTAGGEDGRRTAPASTAGSRGGSRLGTPAAVARLPCTPGGATQAALAIAIRPSSSPHAAAQQQQQLSAAERRSLSSMAEVMHHHNGNKYFPRVERVPWNALVDPLVLQQDYWKNTFQLKATDLELGRNMQPGGLSTRLLGGQWKLAAVGAGAANQGPGVALAQPIGVQG